MAMFAYLIKTKVSILKTPSYDSVFVLNTA
jgi:hypothetical protein